MDGVPYHPHQGWRPEGVLEDQDCFLVFWHGAPKFTRDGKLLELQTHAELEGMSS